MNHQINKNDFDDYILEQTIASSSSTRLKESKSLRFNWTPLDGIYFVVTRNKLSKKITNFEEAIKEYNN